MMEEIGVVYGVLREREIIVFFSSDACSLSKKDFSFNFLYDKGSKSEVPVIDEIEGSSYLIDLASIVSEGSDDSLGLSAFAARYVLDDSELGPLSSLSVTSGGGNFRWAKGYSLEMLLCRGVEDAKSALWFTGSKLRHVDSETLSFVAKQTFLYEFAPPEVKYNAFVVYCYKLIERKEFDENLSSYYVDLCEIRPSGKEHRGAKRDPLCLEISLRTAFWHYCLAKGDIEAVRSVVSPMMEIDFSNRSFPHIGINLSASMLMYSGPQI